MSCAPPVRPLVICLLVVTLNSACGIKRQREFVVSPKLLAARTVSVEDLIDQLEAIENRVSSLSSSRLKITFTSGKVESGRLLEYKSAPGYVLLRKPDSLRMVVQNPITKTTIVDLSSTGDDFSLWYPRDNKYFEGHNSARELETDGENPTFTARPIHIFEALVPPEVDLQNRRLRIAREEQQDLQAKYYVLSLYEDIGEVQLRPLRKLWIERSELVVVKQETFAADGTVESVVRYSDFGMADGVRLPFSVSIDRPGDGYSLDLNFKAWKLNPALADDAFTLNPPPRATLVRLKEKRRSEDH